MLPDMVHADGIRKYGQTRFGGYDHRLAAGDGTLWDMKNLTSDLAPLLSARRPRYLVETLAKPNGLYAKDGLYWVTARSSTPGERKRATLRTGASSLPPWGPTSSSFPTRRITTA